MSTASQRIVASTTATIQWQAVDQDGEPSDPGVVTVTVDRSDGTNVVPAGAATTGTGTDVRQRALTLADTSTLDLLTATWRNAGGDVLGVTTHEIVGGVYASLAEIRSGEPTLSDTVRTSDALLKQCRAEVEAMFEQVCRQAFVPRFSVLAIPNDRRLAVANLRVVRWVHSIASDGSATVVDATLARVGPWGTYGDHVVVGVEHGLDRPPEDIKRAAIAAIRRRANRSAVDQRAMSFTTPTGEVQRFPTPGLGPWVTGLPDVDEVLQRYVMPDTGGVIRLTPSTFPSVPLFVDSWL